MRHRLNCTCAPIPGLISAFRAFGGRDPPLGGRSASLAGRWPPFVVAGARTLGWQCHLSWPRGTAASCALLPSRATPVPPLGHCQCVTSLAGRWPPFVVAGARTLGWQCHLSWPRGTAASCALLPSRATPVPPLGHCQCVTSVLRIGNAACSGHSFIFGAGGATRWGACRPAVLGCAVLISGGGCDPEETSRREFRGAVTPKRIRATCSANRECGLPRAFLHFRRGRCDPMGCAVRLCCF